MSLCFIDMDGVLVDFVGGACKAHNRPDPYLLAESAGVFDMEKLWAISKTAFYKPTLGETFWSDLNPTPEADQIMKLVTDNYEAREIAILTAPTSSPYCVVGKREWVRKYYGFLETQMIFTGAKHFLARSGCVLVDDRDKNIDGWARHGGDGVLVPRLWNRDHANASNVMESVKKQMEEVIG